MMETPVRVNYKNTSLNMKPLPLGIVACIPTEKSQHIPTASIETTTVPTGFCQQLELVNKPFRLFLLNSVILSEFGIVSTREMTRYKT
jgi:hypothetical protein